MNEAIKLAIEKGGWNANENSAAVTLGLFALDPLFWQALAKALGWSEECSNCGYNLAAHEHLQNSSSSTWDGLPPCNEFTPNDWLYHALRYHELILTGGDTSKFWTDLSQIEVVSELDQKIKKALE